VWALQRWARGGLTTIKTDTRCALGLISVAEAQAEESAAFNAAAVAYAKKHDITAPNTAAATAAITGTAANGGHRSPGKIRSSANSEHVLSTEQSIALLKAADASERDSDSGSSGTDEQPVSGSADSTSSSRSGSSGAVLSTVEGAPPLQQQQLPRTRDCPITGCPIEDPAVAADGHTYERYATVTIFTLALHVYWDTKGPFCHSNPLYRKKTEACIKNQYHVVSSAGVGGALMLA
jgi:hypothetical protein